MMFCALVMVPKHQQLAGAPLLPTTRDVMDGLDPHEGRGMVSESLALWENGTQDFVKKILCSTLIPAFAVGFRYRGYPQR